MKTKIYLLLLICFSINFIYAQHENDNWRFGNNNWKFDNSTPNGFTHTTNLNPNIRYTSSIISDKNTGDLLFYCDGYKIFNKNNVVMTNGDALFGSSNTPYQYEVLGNPSDQSSIIVPDPSSQTRYYVFYINGNRFMNDQLLATAPNPTTNYGLRYAIVDMSLNAGLGGVVSKNNILFSNSPTNALTSTFASDGSSYWIITANNGDFLSYKLSASGLNTTPIVSTGATYGSFIKISPNAKKLLTRVNSITAGGVFLADFNNTTGTVNNQMNIIPVSNFSYYYNDASSTPNSAEFSPDSNIIYFISSEANLCTYPSCLYNISWSGLSMYNISTGSLVGVNSASSTHYDFNLSGSIASLQRAKNNKIYLLYNAKLNDTNGYGYKEVIFGYTNPSTGAYTSYDSGVINTPNIWNPTINPLSSITPPINTRNGFSFPQLIPSLDNVNTCPDIRTINQQITTSQNFQAGQSIIASSAINNDLFVNYKAGQNVTLLQGFYVKATTKSLFRAYIGRCDGGIDARSNNASQSIAKKDNQIALSSPEVKIYPNPSSTYINLDSGNEKITSWELVDISGRSILKGSSTQVNVQSLPKATYLLKINTAKNQVTKKVIVK